MDKFLEQKEFNDFLDQFSADNIFKFHVERVKKKEKNTTLYWVSMKYLIERKIEQLTKLNLGR